MARTARHRRASSDVKKGKGVMTAKQRRRPKRSRRRGLLLEAKFKLAKAEFFDGETFADDATPEGKKHRTELLKQAAAFYTSTRAIEPPRPACWPTPGREAQAPWDTELAQEIYEEVLVLMPDDTGGRERSTRRSKTCFVK